MSDFKLNILGCGSAKPTSRHWPSSQVVDYRGNLMMVDCGEAAQVGMSRLGLKFSRLNHIFISHLHGDHCFGLPGLVSTMALHQKGGQLTIHMFREGIEVFRPFLEYFCREMPFELKFNEVPARERSLVLETPSLTVEAFPLKHRVPCVGYLFREKPKQRHLRPDMIRFHEIPVSQLRAIKEGADFTDRNGRVIPNSWLTTDADPSKSYAYCSDTMYYPRLVDVVGGVDLLYHEATYGEELKATARERGHSTAAEAATIARDAAVGRLLLGHYSSRYRDEQPLLEEARKIFPRTDLAYEGMVVDI